MNYLKINKKKFKIKKNKTVSLFKNKTEQKMSLSDELIIQNCLHKANFYVTHIETNET